MQDTAVQALLLLALLQVKHALADFVLQSPYIIENRRHYGHPGGILHVAIHAAGSLAAFLVAGPPGLFVLAAILLAEAVLHYHIDWTKDNFVRARALSPSDAVYWYATGTDQFLHQLTYLGMVWVWLLL